MASWNHESIRWIGSVSVPEQSERMANQKRVCVETSEGTEQWHARAEGECVVSSSENLMKMALKGSRQNQKTW